MSGAEAAHGTPKWLRLDNAANIYPASRGRNWMSVYRFAVTLYEEVDPEILRQAVRSAAARFPAFSARLRKGVFWFYLEHTDALPLVYPDGCCPCEPLRPEENDGLAFRVRYYRKRVSVEFFHVLTDGTGALSFTKTLAAEYLRLRHGAEIPCVEGIKDLNEAPRPSEYEDSFQKYAGGPKSGRFGKYAYRIRGHREPDGFVNVTCGILPVSQVLERARAMGATATQYLAGVLLLAIADVQSGEVALQSRRKPVRLNIPVNLRTIFPSETTRNFWSFVSPGIDPGRGEYSLEEAVRAVHHQMGAEATEKNLRAKFSKNVSSEKNRFMRVVPLFIKVPVIKLMFLLAGDRKTSATLTNLGNITLPDEMSAHVERIEVIKGPLRVNPLCCAVMSYNGEMYLNMTRSITSPKVERAFLRRLVRLGIHVKVESNQRI